MAEGPPCRNWRVKPPRGHLGVAIAFLLAALASGIAAAGCGGSSGATLRVPKLDPTRSSPEALVLNEIYAQALSNAGYNVERVARPAPGETGFETLKSQRLSGYPDHLSTLLHDDLGVEIEQVPTRRSSAHRMALARLEARRLTAFPPTPFGVANGVALLRKTAEAVHLATISDLEGKADDMTIKAPTYCHLSLDCLGAIESRYRTAFEVVSYEPGYSVDLSWQRPEPDFRYEVLEDGESDASIVFTTDGRLAAESDKFVVLGDDKHAFPAGNVSWVTSRRVVEEAGPDYEQAIVAAQRGLSLKTMQQLDAEVELEGHPAPEVAAHYLDSLG